MTTALNGPPAGRAAIVTGGSRGVGRAAIRCLAARGYAVDFRPGSGIRVGPHFFSTEDECHAVLAEMATIRDGH